MALSSNWVAFKQSFRNAMESQERKTGFYRRTLRGFIYIYFGSQHSFLSFQLSILSSAQEVQRLTGKQGFLGMHKHVISHMPLEAKDASGQWTGRRQKNTLLCIFIRTHCCLSMDICRTWKGIIQIKVLKQLMESVILFLMLKAHPGKINPAKQ